MTAARCSYTYTDDTATHSACNSPWCLVDWPPLQAIGAPTAISDDHGFPGRDHRGRGNPAGDPGRTSALYLCRGSPSRRYSGSGHWRRLVDDFANRIARSVRIMPPTTPRLPTGPPRACSGRHRPSAGCSCLAGALGLAGCSSSTPAATITQVGGPQETNSNYPGALVFPKEYTKPNVVLTDTANQPFNIATDTPDKVTLVYFGYTHCPDLCPLNMYLAASSIAGMPAVDRHDVQVVFVTTDPTRDTPASSGPG